MEKKERKVRVKKMKEKVPMKERLGSLFFTILSLAIAVVVFAGFMVLQSVFSENIIYKEVLTVVKNIPEGEILTEENIKEYFGIKKVNELYAVSESVAPGDMEKLVGLKARVPLYVGEEVVPTDFTNVNVYLDYIENPVEMSIATGGIAGTDGGKIRAGDIVNITMMFTKEQLGMNGSSNGSTGTNTGVYNPSSSSSGTMDDYLSGEGANKGTGEQTSEKPQLGSLTSVSDTTTGYNFGYYAKYMLENIYIKEVLASDGSVISPTDTTSVAAIFIVVVPKEIELQLNNIISNCSSMRISKVLYEISPQDLFRDSSLEQSIANLEEIPDAFPEDKHGSEGWTEPDEHGVIYKANGDGTHLASDGEAPYEEACSPGDDGRCTRCMAVFQAQY